MSRNEQITVAETTAGKGASGRQGRQVSLPVVELLTGRGFVTGKSGSGKSNTASVIAEELLESGFGLLIVDVDGEYYGLKEEYEILHAGADEECDVRVTPDHAEKLASLALERNVPIILDLSSFLDEDEAEAVLTAIAKHLFAKAKKQKQPFLLLVEEVHEYIPENGSVGEAGKMLIKIGKRGRKHGLGICGMSQRPADVKKDFITQCDWLVWHRLTWNNDTKVVRRVLDGEYASAVEDLNDGEGFMVTDWTDRVRRVQFYRKQTFDAGATPGLGDVDRPDLKSVSDDLVSELADISDERQAREDRIAELREQLDEKNSRIAELEAELQDARDLSRMAEQFVDAMLANVEGAAPGRTERERQRQERQRTTDDVAAASTTDAAANTAETTTTETAGAGSGSADDARSSDDQGFMDAFGDMMDDTGDDASTEADSTSTSKQSAAANGESPSANGDGSQSKGSSDADQIEGLAALAGLDDADGDAESESSTGSSPSQPAGANDGGRRAAADGGLTVGSFSSEVSEFEAGARAPRDEEESRARSGSASGRPPAVGRVASAVEELDAAALGMAALYRDGEPATPEDVYTEAAGRVDRVEAYAQNRALRRAGLVQHAGRGYYEYCLRETLDAALADTEREDMADVYARDIEQEYLD